MERINEIIDYWFEDYDEDDEITKESLLYGRWFNKDKETDKYIKKNFEKDVNSAVLDKHKEWEESPEGRLSLILLLDQFARNIYRGNARAFDGDLKALELSFRTLKDGTIDKLRLIERLFVYMPLMHSENIEIQEMAVEYFAKLLKRAEEEEDVSLEFYQNSYNFAVKHRDAIAQFKRFPHRNKLLKRRSTSDEITFLQNPENHF